MKLKKYLFVFALLAMIPTRSEAFEWKEWINDWKDNVSDTWKCGRLDVYVPFYAWHNRMFYDDKHIRKYNEEAWGFGLGKGLWDGNEWHGLYFMAFKDSNFYLETMFGYGYQYNWNLSKDGAWKFGAGYTIGFTQRHEYSYIPVPLPLPVASLTYDRFSLQAAYVPGIRNNGNVLFMWMRFSF